MTSPECRIHITKSRLTPEWLCRLVPSGASRYDDNVILIGRFDSQSVALLCGTVALYLARYWGVMRRLPVESINADLERREERFRRRIDLLADDPSDTVTIVRRLP